MPLATSGGSACFISREIQAGLSWNRPVAASRSILNAATAPLKTSPCSTGRLELRMLRSPEGHEHPARAFLILVAGHRAVDSGRLIILIFIADERRAVVRRRMIFTAQRAGIEEPRPALLAALHNPFAPCVLEDRTSHLQIQVALQEILGIGRTVVVGQLQFPRRRIEFHRNHGRSIRAQLGIDRNHHQSRCTPIRLCRSTARYAPTCRHCPGRTSRFFA